MKHTHYCSFCRQFFDCSTPFCEGLNPMACDDCYTPEQLDNLAANIQSVLDYMREREENPQCVS